MRGITAVLVTLGCLLTASCSELDIKKAQQPLDAAAAWTLLPFVNHTDVPQAGLRAEAIAEGLLRVRGIAHLQRYPAELNTDTVFEPAERKVVDQALDWARRQKARYALTGVVDEWHYKAGVDGEPAVGLTLQVIDLETGAVVWNAVGARSGGSREAISAVAQKLQRDMLESVALLQSIQSKL